MSVEIQEEKDEDKNTSKNDHSDIIEREKEISRKIEESRKHTDTRNKSSDLLNFTTYLTHTLSGTIQDIDVYDHHIVLHIQTDEGEVSVEVRDNREYSENNELSRLLESKNITDGKIGNLIGKNIKLKINGFDWNRETDVKDLDLSVDIPEGFDIIDKTKFRISSVSRRLGTNISYLFENAFTKNDRIANILLISMIISGGLALFMSYTLAITGIINLLLPHLAISGWLFSLLLTMTVGLQYKLLNEAFRKYEGYREEDRIHN